MLITSNKEEQKWKYFVFIFFLFFLVDFRCFLLLWISGGFFGKYNKYSCIFFLLTPPSTSKVISSERDIYSDSWFFYCSWYTVAINFSGEGRRRGKKISKPRNRDGLITSTKGESTLLPWWTGFEFLLKTFFSIDPVPGEVQRFIQYIFLTCLLIFVLVCHIPR